MSLFFFFTYNGKVTKTVVDRFVSLLEQIAANQNPPVFKELENLKQQTVKLQHAFTV